MPLAYQFAEGATGTFFDTDLLLANPTAAQVPVTITYLTENARVVTSSLFLPAQSRTTVSADANTLLGDTAFSSTVTSHLGVPIAVERTMRWGAGGYGMHTEKAAPALARDWFFAEGAQGFYDTFYLLTNPAPAPNVATIRFFLENGTQVTRTYQPRRAVAADRPRRRDPGARQPVVRRPGDLHLRRRRRAGDVLRHAGLQRRPRVRGRDRPSTNWFLAEGATGSFFTTFVLLSNPNPRRPP